MPPTPTAEMTPSMPGSLQQDVDQARLPLEHGRIGNVLGGFRDRDDESGVLLRKEALRDHDIEIAGQDDGCDRRRKRERAMAQHPAQA